jgi:hypothetical protein
MAGLDIRGTDEDDIEAPGSVPYFIRRCNRSGNACHDLVGRVIDRSPILE